MPDNDSRWFAGAFPIRKKQGQAKVPLVLDQVPGSRPNYADVHVGPCGWPCVFRPRSRTGAQRN
eukprot:2572467-Rhodomonas_salina.4